MSTPIEHIDINSLSIDERTLLAHRLLNSVRDEAENAPLTAEQTAELERRMADIDSGRVSTIPWDEARTRLAKLLRG